MSEAEERALGHGMKVGVVQFIKGAMSTGEELFFRSQAGIAQNFGCALFQWRRAHNAVELHEAFAQRGIFTRLFLTPMSLRFGFPQAEADWQRLDAALHALPAPALGTRLQERRA